MSRWLLLPGLGVLAIIVGTLVMNIADAQENLRQKAKVRDGRWQQHERWQREQAEERERWRARGKPDVPKRGGS